MSNTFSLTKSNWMLEWSGKVHRHSSEGGYVMHSCGGLIIDIAYRQTVIVLSRRYSSWIYGGKKGENGRKVGR